ncbi:MAG: hypothetical protein IK999_08655 [Ruminococcus sp.]|nr:hypothetical protein [Ruminococcus sp.]
MVNVAEKQLPAEAEINTKEIMEFIDEITPDLEELSGRMARIRQLLNSEDTSARERREAVRAIGQIFKYGMCEGFDSLYDVPGSDDSGEDADMRFLQNMKLQLTRKDKQMRRWVNTLGISDSLECGVIVGTLMWKILVTMADLIVSKRKEADR